MKKHAYLIVSNANFKVLALCIKMIDDVRNDIFILFDQKAKISNELKNSLKALCVYSKMEICEQTVNWGGYSQVSAVLKLIENANKKGDYQYIHFFQGSDLPIKKQDDIHCFFDRHDGKQFVMVEKKRQAMAVNKTAYRHYFCDNRYFRTCKWMKLLNFGLVYLQKLFHIKMKLNMDVYQGSALFSITGECARYIESMKDKIYRCFRWTLAPDEVFIQSILMDSPYQMAIAGIDRDISANSRLIDRTRPDGKNSPHIWRLFEFDYIINQPEEICFARKFDERVDFEIAEKIYKTIKD